MASPQMSDEGTDLSTYKAQPQGYQVKYLKFTQASTEEGGPAKQSKMETEFHLGAVLMTAPSKRGSLKLSEAPSHTPRHTPLFPM